MKRKQLLETRLKNLTDERKLVSKWYKIHLIIGIITFPIGGFINLVIAYFKTVRLKKLDKEIFDLELEISK